MFPGTGLFQHLLVNKTHGKCPEGGLSCKHKALRSEGEGLTLGSRVQGVSPASPSLLDQGRAVCCRDSASLGMHIMISIKKKSSLVNGAFQELTRLRARSLR